MYRKISKKLVVLLLFVSISTYAAFIRSSVPPQGYTGADGVYCTQCHATNPLNSAGGDVVINGLPESYEPGQTYNISIAINHSAADRRRWGFSVLARNGNGSNVGSFSSTNTNTALNGNELSHSNAASTLNSSSYAYQNLAWTAPANPTDADANITFFVTGLAGNGSGSSGDFVYASSKIIPRNILLATTYTFTGNGLWSDPANWANNTVPPASISGNVTIIINPPAEGECVLDVQQTVTGGATLQVAEGKKFTVNGNLTVNGQ